MAGVEQSREVVRPTRRCLIQDLNLAIPTIDVNLEDTDQPIIRKAQATPARVAAGDLERIVAITDRIWIKVKVHNWRGAVTEVESELQETQDQSSSWWLGAAGQRKDDSPHSDFYASFEKACRLKQHKEISYSSSDRINSQSFMPEPWDFKRLAAEHANRLNDLIKRDVRELVARSLQDGHIHRASFIGWQLEVCIRANENSWAEAYITVTGRGMADANLLALILGSIPGIAPGDWFPEPSPIAGLTPQSGELIWSALLSTEVQSELLT